MKIERLLLLVFLLGLAACGSQTEEETATPVESTNQVAPGPGGMMGRGMGPGSGMMARHSAPIPQEYDGLTNPVAATEESLARGEEIFTTYCVTCHGEGGMGDGPGSANLDPAPPPIAHTSQMLGDDYLFWRVSEGGAMAPFNSAMPAWKDTLEEQARWDVINYIRALGSGQVMPGRGGAVFDPQAEAAQRAEMLAQAVDQEVITRAEADLFGRVHGMMDERMAGGMGGMTGTANEVRTAVLTELVNDGRITQAQADSFNETHDKLVEAGLMQ